MLRIIQCKSAEGAASYYSSADYYLEGQELPGVWRGEGAARLGLAGAIDGDDWRQLCYRRDPNTGQSLLQRQKAISTVAYDFNFHVPKSVSLLYAQTQDKRLLRAFREAVGDTMEDVQSDAATRVRKQGQAEDRRTGNLIWGEFVHMTSRPVDGVPDPHLHAHAVVINATYDEKEHAWKAAQFRELKRDAPYYEALFHGRLARRLADLGLPIEQTRKGWEIGSLDKSMLDKFSRRTAEIEAKAKELGVTSPDAKSQLGAKTRSAKAKQLTLKELQTEWRSRLTGEESKQLDGVIRQIGSEAKPIDGKVTEQAIQYALSHELERASVAQERRVLATAMKRAVGEIPPEAILAAFPQVNLIRRTQHGRTLVTTPQVLAEEREIVAFAKQGRGACDSLAPTDYVLERDFLNESQRGAVRHVLSSRDRVIVVEGKAGVGKTTLMQETVEAIQKSGTKVVAFAPSGAASRGVLRDEGFTEADTLKSLLVDQKVQEKAIGAVIWVDEAGLVGTRDLRDLFRLANELNARLLLTGDRFQHGSVSRGAALRLLEEEAGIKPASVREIQRQEGKYKEAVTHLSEGRTLEGYDAFDKLGWVKESKLEERHALLATDYVAALKKKRTALIVAPTHAEGDRVTAAVREKLKESKRLGKEEREFTTLSNAHLTEAERTNPGAYEEGDVIQFFQNTKGYTRGDRVRLMGGKEAPVDQAARYTVFKSRTTRIAAGDLIRITHNGMSLDGKHRLNNGAIYQVKGFDGAGNLKLANGWTVGRDFGHFTHGYAVTSFASQGRTVDHVFIAEGQESLPAANNPQFYVSVSRARRSATIYTDDKAALREAVERSDDRITATELAENRLRERVRRRDASLAPQRGVEQKYERTRELVHER